MNTKELEIMVFVVVMSCSSQSDDLLDEYIASIPGLKCKPSKKPAEADGKLSSFVYLLLLVYLLAYSFTLKKEAICFPEMLCSLQTTQHYHPGDCTLHSHWHENLTSNIPEL
jgi:hypothetical protein